MLAPVAAEATTYLTARMICSVHVRVRGTCPDRREYLGEASRAAIYSLPGYRDHIDRSECAGNGGRGRRASLRGRHTARRSQIRAQKQHDPAAEPRTAKVDVRLEHGRGAPRNPGGPPPRAGESVSSTKTPPPRR